MATKVINTSRAPNRYKEIEEIIIDNDDDEQEQLLYNVKNLKIFSIDQSDKHAMRYDLLTKTGELKLFLNKNHKLKLSLNEISNLSDGYREFIDIPFDSVKFNELRIKNKKLTINNKQQTSKNAYCFESNSSNIDELIEIHKSLMKFKEIYHPELSVKEENKQIVKINKSEEEASSLKTANNKNERKSKKRKFDEEEVIKICDVLTKAIKTGKSDEAGNAAKMLAEFELDISINMNENNNNDDFQKVEVIGGLFDAHCVLIKENDKEKKNIFLETLNLNMKISELKLKVFNEFKIAESIQNWIINDNAAEDDYMLKYYLQQTKNADKTIEAKFQLFLTSKRNKNDEHVPMDIDENFDGWKCDICTLINEATKEECEVCGSKQVGFKKPKQDVNVPTGTKEVDKLKNQKLSDYLAFDMQDLIENTEKFECEICLDDEVGPQEGAVLKECLHVFCKGCLREHILHCDNATIKCPYSKDYVCQATIQEREIRSLISEDEYKKVQLKSLKQGEAIIENTFHCKTPDCIGFCVYEDNLHWFECPVCEQTNCLRCDVVHMGKTCDEYKGDLKQKAVNDKILEEDKKALENMVKKGEAMYCPGCKILVFKDIGCDWLTCFVCKMEICWATRGTRWGPKGRGDISGGCKCNTNGKLCHPKCGNCH